MLGDRRCTGGYLGAEADAASSSSASSSSSPRLSSEVSSPSSRPLPLSISRSPRLLSDRGESLGPTPAPPPPPPPPPLLLRRLRG